MHRTTPLQFFCTVSAAFLPAPHSRYCKQRGCLVLRCTVIFVYESYLVWYMMLKPLFFVLLFVGQNLLCACQHIPVAHLTIYRRGGALAQHQPANLTALVKLLHDVEGRYSRAIREVKGNKLVRKWRARSTGATDDEQLLREPGQEGSW
jgi:hypothetical protein